MTTAENDDDQRIADLVYANRILADQGVLDAFGHVSVRSAANPAHFFQAVSRAPALVRRSDVREFDENSELVPGATGKPYGERYIHGEILRARPDVQAVVHSHSFGVIPFGVAGYPMRALCHQAAFLPGASPVFEVRDVGGDDNGMLVENNALGAGVARSLGGAPVVLMRGHGNAVVGPSLQVAVYRAVYTEINARLILESLRFGTPLNYLNEFELRKMGANTDRSVWRAWEYWTARVAEGLGGAG